MANFDPMSTDYAPTLCAARYGANPVVEHADLLDRDPGKAVCWRGSADEASAALSDLVAVAAELAARGLRATLTVEPVGDELLAAVRIT